jgi:hypothetical protein
MPPDLYKKNKKTSNIEHRTSNIQHAMPVPAKSWLHWMFNVECWLLDVPFPIPHSTPTSNAGSSRNFRQQQDRVVTRELLISGPIGAK